MNTIWEDEKSIEPKKNCSSKTEPELRSIINKTENGSTENEWRDIGGVRKWIRSCPECGEEMLCGSIKYKQKSDILKRTCKACTWKNKFGERYLIRSCPLCKSEITYLNRRNRTVCEKRGSVCKLCQNKIHSEKTKGKSLEELIGAEKSKKRRKKQSDATRGKPKPKEWIVKISGKNNPNFGRVWTEEERNIARKRMAKMLIERKWVFRNYNPEACKYFDTLSIDAGWKLKHALNGGEETFIGYFVDAYDREKNIVVEYDEPAHYYADGTLKKIDIDRMIKIIDNTGCRFFRYNEQKKKLYECKRCLNSFTIV